MRWRAIVAREGGALDAGAIARIEVDTYVWAAQLDQPGAAQHAGGEVLAPLRAREHASSTAHADRRRPFATRRAPIARDSRARGAVTVREDAALTAKLPGAASRARARSRWTNGRVPGGGGSDQSSGDTEDPYSAAEVARKIPASWPGRSCGAGTAAAIVAKLSTHCDRGAVDHGADGAARSSRLRSSIRPGQRCMTLLEPRLAAGTDRRRARRLRRVHRLAGDAAGFETLYVSGAAIAYTRLGRPDIGLVT